MAPSNCLPVHGNEKTMNLNSLVLANIQASPYFKVYLYDLKTYHQVVDEIYYKVNHLEPWEKGSRNTAGQTGMCGGVRGVGTGGIVSSSFCLLYKLFTLKLTRKQLIGVCTHADSPYIRGLGLMYIRFTQPPQDLWEWYEPYLDDDEEVDVKAGGGHLMTIGDMCVQMLTRLEWYSTLFPRIPIPIQKTIEYNLTAHRNKSNYAGGSNRGGGAGQEEVGGRDEVGGGASFGEAERRSRRDDNEERYSSREPGSRSRELVGGNEGGRERGRGSRDIPAEARRSSHNSSPSSYRSRYRSRSRDDRSKLQAERLGSRSRDELRGSRSDVGRRGSRSRDERQISRSHDDRRKSGSQDKKVSNSRDERRDSRTREVRRRSRSKEKSHRDERRRSRDRPHRDDKRRSRSGERSNRDDKRRSRSGERSHRDQKRRSRSGERSHREERRRSGERSHGNGRSDRRL